MSKRLKLIIALLIVGVLIYAFNYWQKSKIDLERVEMSNGWFKYANDQVEFEYPGKLRNCYECMVASGSVYTVMTDENYIIMFMCNYNSAYLVNPQMGFLNQKTKEGLIVRNRIDSILIKHGVVPTDGIVEDSLVINEIKFNEENDEMNFNMEILGVPINSVITTEEMSVCGASSWGVWSLVQDEGYLEKFAFGTYSGRFNLQKGEEEIFFEMQKIKRNTLYNHDEKRLSQKDMLRFYKSIELRE